MRLINWLLTPSFTMRRRDPGKDLPCTVRLLHDAIEVKAPKEGTWFRMDSFVIDDPIMKKHWQYTNKVDLSGCLKKEWLVDILIEGRWWTLACKDEWIADKIMAKGASLRSSRRII